MLNLREIMNAYAAKLIESMKKIIAQISKLYGSDFTELV